MTVIVTEEAWKASREARGIAVEALRRLFRDKPELLEKCSDSGDRSLTLIVGPVAGVPTKNKSGLRAGRTS